MKVRDVMTTAVLTVSVDASLQEVARLLIDRRISGLPVVDAEGHLVGVVSEADFLAKQAGPAPARLSPLRWLTGSPARAKRDAMLLHATTAGEAMSQPPITIGPDRPLSEAAALMARSSVNRLPVIQDDRVVGIVTRADIVRAFARDDSELVDVVRNAVRAVDGLRVVDVRNGVAVLSGTVAHSELVPTVHALIEAIDGIVGVDDDDVAWLESDRPHA